MNSETCQRLLDNFTDLATQAEPVAGVCVAYSGGVDSTALLLISQRWCQQNERPLTAIHIDHGLHRESIAWAQHCTTVCMRLGIPLQTIQVIVQASGQGLEMAARNARYQAFATALPKGWLLATAHHMDDQAETVLMHLLRGSGPDGLAGIPPLRAFENGHIVRPLLPAMRSALIALVQQAKLPWIEDVSNADTTRARNFLRHNILPRLIQRWPAAHRSIAQSAQQCRQAATTLRSLSQEDLTHTRSHRLMSLRIAPLLELSDDRQRLTLREWLRQAGLPLPGVRHLDEILRQLRSRVDATPLIAWQGAEVRRYRECLYCMAPVYFPAANLTLNWDAMRCDLPADLGHLEWHMQSDRASRPPTLDIRFNTHGLRMQPHDRQCHKTLKALCQEAGVPPWERQRLPCVWRGNELLAIGNLWWTQPCAALMGKHGVCIEWQRQSERRVDDAHALG